VIFEVSLMMFEIFSLFWLILFSSQWPRRNSGDFSVA